MELADRLREAVADRYAVEGELGRGGMAVVYLARDLRHERRVAIKVLRPELTVTLVADRFLREIQIAAQLQHPLIVPLYDSGGSDQLLWYVMPYIEGETLRQRLQREQQLPLEDALQIADDAVEALTCAHQHRFVHRDIKPENILLSGGHAMLTDFGIARALTRAAGEGTSSGVAIGTPAYMSPEQASGGATIDARSDVYSLGCLLYEMLAGEPPFTGPTPQAVIARHVSQAPPPVRVVRPGVPVDVEAAIGRALEKAPADRFQTAAEFGAALAGARRARPAWRRLALPGALALLALLWWPISRAIGPRGARPDARVIAVLPFRVSTGDSAVAFLAEGMIDLLAARLTGATGSRAVDPRAVMSGWRRSVAAGRELPENDAVRLARRLGAGRLISGGVVGMARNLVIRASLRSTRAVGGAAAQATVEGPLDSLTALVDRLAAQLLALEAGESRYRLAALTSTSLSALRAYLEGQAAYRRGQYDGAVTLFRRAVEEDTSFALAAIGLRNAAVWTPYASEAAALGLRAAWLARERLSPPDRAYLDALAGPTYPEPSSFAQQLAGWERAVREVPDRAEAWYELGEVLVHWAPLMDVSGARQRAAEAFRRAVELDSTFSAPVEHLFDLAGLDGDTAGVRRFGSLYLTRDSGTLAQVARWQMAVALGDTVALRQTRARFDALDLPGLAATAFFSQVAAVWTTALEDGQQAADAMKRRATTAEETAFALGVMHDLALNRGRPLVSGQALDQLEQLDHGAAAPRRQRVLDALYWDGDTAAAATAVAWLVRQVAGEPGSDPERRQDARRSECVVAQWEVQRGDRRRARAIASGLEGDGAAAPATEDRLCAALVRAAGAAGERSDSAAVLVERLDGLLREGPAAGFVAEANLALSRLRESRGELAGALAAVRRRPLAIGWEKYLSTFLESEGRLASAVATGPARCRRIGTTCCCGRRRSRGSSRALPR